MHNGATEVTQNERNHGNKNHLNCGRHCPMMPQGAMVPTAGLKIVMLSGAKHLMLAYFVPFMAQGFTSAIGPLTSALHA
jgi:hypothetical protein